MPHIKKAHWGPLVWKWVKLQSPQKDRSIGTKAIARKHYVYREKTKMTDP